MTHKLDLLTIRKPADTDFYSKVTRLLANVHITLFINERHNREIKE